MIKQDKILDLLRDGWHLGVGSGISGRVWMQRHLMCGGESFDCYFSSFQSLLSKKAVMRLKAKKSDPYWLSRYGLSPLPPAPDEEKRG